MTAADKKRLGTALDTLQDAFADQRRAAQANQNACQELRQAIDDLQEAASRFHSTAGRLDVSRLRRKSSYLIHLMDCVEQGRQPLRVV